MRFTKLLPLKLIGAVALLAVAAPGFAQNAAPALARGGDLSGGQALAATVDMRPTNLQRPPILVNFLTVVALPDLAGQGGRTAVAASRLGRPSQN